MFKRCIVSVVLFLLVLSFACVSQAWQGRMGGMEDPYGLVQDESDFLIHPAKIANGQGIKLYGDYQFNYTGVLKWDNEVDIFSALTYIYPRDTSGDELRHKALVGAAFPLGFGRMGLFFTYDGMRGDYDGKDTCWDPVPSLYHDTYDLKSDLDNFAFRLLYGLPIGGGFKLGAEAQIAYSQEENKTLYNEDDLTSHVLDKNYPFGDITIYENLFPFMMPYDSSYWEALFKGSLDGKVGPLDLEFTLRGGFDFGGDNKYEWEEQDPIGTPVVGFGLKGDVTGWQIGGDLWLRYPLATDLTLPFLVRIDYQEKTRDGDGPGWGYAAGEYFDYKEQEKNLAITVGGGVDKELAKGAKIAAGIYYNYLQGDNALLLMEYPGGGFSLMYDSSDYPDSTEHQVMLRLAGELELSPAVTLRMGLAPFYGWVRQNFTYTYDAILPFTDHISSDCYHWGIGASFGGTIKFKPLALEPFINGGWQQLHIQGNGDRVTIPGGLADLLEMSTDKDEWFAGGGLSILFDL
jgi:hypothetical protein